MTSLYEISYYWIEQHITLTLPAWRCLFTVRITWLLSTPLLSMRSVGVVVWLSLSMAKVPCSTRTHSSVVSVIFFCLHCVVLFALFFLFLEKVPGKGAFFFSSVWQLYIRDFIFKIWIENILKKKYYCKKGISPPMKLW